MTDFPARGLYAITPAGVHAPAALRSAVADAIAGGAKAIQYRDKSADRTRRQEEASALAALCRARGVPLIINDDIELAVQVGADGVHVGEHDTGLADARAALGDQSVIGVSCYRSLSKAKAAESGGADYVAFGSVYPSPTKPGAPLCPIEVLASARAQLSIPRVAIGGITADNAGPLLSSGADLLAVVQAVFGAPDIRAAAARFARLFD